MLRSRGPAGCAAVSAACVWNCAARFVATKMIADRHIRYMAIAAATMRRNNGRNWREGEYTLRIRAYERRNRRGEVLYDESFDFEIARDLHGTAGPRLTR